MNSRRDYTKLGKNLVAAAILSVLLAYVAVPRSQADDRAKCQQRVERAQARLDDAIRRYGGNSKQAINSWHQFNAENERCWNLYHEWWSKNDHQWRKERDWDRYDPSRGYDANRGHDHDHDQDRH